MMQSDLRTFLFQGWVMPVNQTYQSGKSKSLYLYVEYISLMAPTGPEVHPPSEQPECTAPFLQVHQI